MSAILRDMRKRLPNISSRAFEHPADRAALAALKKIPLFDLVLRKLIGFVGERSLRLAYLSSAVRVNEHQFSRLNAIYDECLQVLDVPTRPELYVSQAPFVNAGAIGTDQPFIVLNSATLELCDDDELRYILGHELGHVLADHVLYKTMLELLLRLTVGGLGIPLGQLAIIAIVSGLSEWSRKSEISCDRAGLLCVQDPRKTYGVIMKMAGGRQIDQMNIDEFERQAADYEAGGSAVDSVFKLMHLIGRSHPFHVVRLNELRKWIASGEYDRILLGQYPTRDTDPKTSAYDELKSSFKQYKEDFDQSKDPLLDLLKTVSQDMGQAATKVWEELRKQFK